MSAGRRLSDEAKKLAEGAAEGHSKRVVLVVLQEEGADGMALLSGKTDRSAARKAILATLKHVLATLEGN